MTGWAIVEAMVGLILVVLSCYVLVRPQYRDSRFLLGMAVAAFAVGVVAVVDGLHR